MTVTPPEADARPLAVIVGSDLMFGSKIESALDQAGCDARYASLEDVEDRLAGARLLLVDLAEEPERACATVERLREAGRLSTVGTLGHYQHVDDDTRRRAVAAGFDMVAPRSRVFREGPELIGSLLAG